MERKEEIEKESSIFSERVSHGHHYRDLMCGFEAGAQWADKTMLEKADEWLKANINNYLVHGRDIDYLFDDFKQAMMEE